VTYGNTDEKTQTPLRQTVMFVVSLRPSIPPSAEIQIVDIHRTVNSHSTKEVSPPNDLPSHRSQLIGRDVTKCSGSIHDHIASTKPSESSSDYPSMEPFGRVLIPISGVIGNQSFDHPCSKSSANMTPTLRLRQRCGAVMGC
jgi:hypothetical protein